MKISEVTQARVTRTSGNKVEVDHGDGTTTTVDTRKNPQAISRDEKGQLKINTNPSNSKMNGNRRQQGPRPGEKIEIDDENQ